MKLKTKFQDEDFELGEVVDADIYHGGNGKVKVTAYGKKGGSQTFYCESLKELNNLFEDYEEPKEFWNIEWDGAICHTTETIEEEIRLAKLIGNYFETKEEAEKAVERLRAWERLRDKGFRFKKINLYDGTISFSMPMRAEVIDDDDPCWVSDDFAEEDKRDLHALFGGEE